MDRARASRGFLGTLWLCLRSRCPICGVGNFYRPITQIQSFIEIWQPIERCGKCDFVYRRETGYFFGAVIPLLPILSLLVGALSAIVAYSILKPENPEDLLPYGLLGLIVGFVSLYRVVIAIYVTADLTLSPPEDE